MPGKQRHANTPGGNFPLTESFRIFGKTFPTVKKTLIVFFSLLFCCCLFSAATVNAQHAGVFRDIVYKVSQGDSLRLDIFLPEAATTPDLSPVVIIIHGGGWVEGDRNLATNAFMRKLRDQLNHHGVAVVSIDYTLVSKSTHLPTPVTDCKDAVRWVRAQAATYGFDPANIGLWGGSAGGHLALLTAYMNDIPADTPVWDPPPAAVKYVIDFFGPTDLNRLLRTKAGTLRLFVARLVLGKKILSIRKKLIFALTGYAVDSHQRKAREVLRRYSPVQYVANAVPTFLFHGTKDHVVPLKQSRKLHRLLDARGVQNELIVVDKADHGFNNIDNARQEALVAKTVGYVLAQSGK